MFGPGILGEQLSLAHLLRLHKQNTEGKGKKERKKKKEKKRKRNEKKKKKKKEKKEKKLGANLSAEM